MAKLEFNIRLESPGFLGELRRGCKVITYLRKNRDRRFEKQRSMVDHYPIQASGLRIPSLRGVLAFWYRAVLGDLGSEEVYERQGRVFGSATAGQGVSLRPGGAARFQPGELRFTEEPYAHVYLGYGPLQVLKVDGPEGQERPRDIATTYNRLHARDAALVEEDERPLFPFVAQGRRDQITELKRALTLLHLFGGVGGRSRRGWGSVSVEAEFLCAPPADQGVSVWVKGLLESVWLSSEQEGTRGTRSPRFSALSSTTEVRVTPPLDGGYDAVLMEFYRRFKKVRLWRPFPSAPTADADHTIEQRDSESANALTGVPARLAYGMPYHPISRRGHRMNWEIEYVGRRSDAEPGKDEISRRSSPLFLKVLRLADGRHVGVALFLDAEFFGNVDYQVGAKGKLKLQPFPGYAAVLDFLNEPQWSSVPVSQQGGTAS